MLLEQLFKHVCKELTSMQTHFKFPLKHHSIAFHNTLIAYRLETRKWNREKKLMNAKRKLI